mmetsp:Transcript_146254/g.467277  ORF Transcript_146254/g.467277 Transcript_146254/m.467277 type:complete len:281 (+) Transcript_146254:213-1055(+)
MRSHASSTCFRHGECTHRTSRSWPRKHPRIQRRRQRQIDGSTGKPPPLVPSMKGTKGWPHCAPREPAPAAGAFSQSALPLRESASPGVREVPGTTRTVNPRLCSAWARRMASSHFVSLATVAKKWSRACVAFAVAAPRANPSTVMRDAATLGMLFEGSWKVLSSRSTRHSGGRMASSSTIHRTFSPKRVWSMPVGSPGLTTGRTGDGASAGAACRATMREAPRSPFGDMARPTNTWAGNRIEASATNSDANAGRECRIRAHRDRRGCAVWSAIASVGAIG